MTLYHTWVHHPGYTPVPLASPCLHRWVCWWSNAEMTAPWALTFGFTLGGGPFAGQVSSFLFNSLSLIRLSFPPRPRVGFRRSDVTRVQRLLAAYGTIRCCGRCQRLVMSLISPGRRVIASLMSLISELFSTPAPGVLICQNCKTLNPGR